MPPTTTFQRLLLAQEKTDITTNQLEGRQIFLDIFVVHLLERAESSIVP